MRIDGLQAFVHAQPIVVPGMVRGIQRAFGLAHDAQPQSQSDHSTTSDRARSPRNAWCIVGVLVACILLWLTDALHGISPGWVALAAALYCLLPASHLTPGQCIDERINYGSLFTVGIVALVPLELAWWFVLGLL